MRRIFFFLLLCSGFALAQDPVGVHRFTNQMVHSNSVTSTAYSPDGSKIVSGGFDGTIKIWDAASQYEIATFKDSGWTYSVAFSPDGTKIVSGNTDSTIKIWNVASGNEIATLKGHNSWVRSVAFSPDGTKIVSGSWDNTIKIWNVISGIEMATLKGHDGHVSSVAFSPDGTKIVSGSLDSTIKIWDTTSQYEITTLKGHTDYVSSVAFSPDGTKIVSGSGDYTVKIWNAASGKEIATLKGHNPYSVNSVAFSPDGTKIISGSGDYTVKIWNAASGNEIATLKGHSFWVNSVAFSPDGTKVISGSYDRTIKIWNVASGKEIVTPEGHTNFVNSVAFSPDGAKIISGSADNTIKIWNVASGNEIVTLKGHADHVGSVTYSPDGTKIASRSGDETIKIWNAVSGNEIATIKGYIYSPFLTFSPDGTKIVSKSEDDTIKIWDTASGNEITALKGFPFVSSAVFSPDGTKIVLGGGLHPIIIWNLVSGYVMTTRIGHLRDVSSLAVSPDGTKIASGSWDSTIKIWNVASGNEMATLKGHSGQVSSVAFSPDGKKIVSRSWDNTIKIWNVASGNEIVTLKGHNDWSNSVAFSPDGTKIVSIDYSTVNIWDIEAKKMIKSFDLNHTIKHISFSSSQDSILVATSAYWITFPLNTKQLLPESVPIRLLAEEKKLPAERPRVSLPQEERQIKTDNNMAPVQLVNAPFATHFWHSMGATEESPLRSTQKTVTLSGEWRASFDISACEVRLFLNGEPIQPGGKTLGSEKKKETDITNNVTVELKEGNNYAQWKLTCPNGYENRSATRYFYYDDINQPNLYVYSFGVASDLKFTRNDAEYIKTLFESQRERLFKNVFASAYTGGTETRADNIKITMERISNNSNIRPQDVVLIFFSSHGLPSADDGFTIQAANFDPYAPTNTTLRYREDILTHLEKRPSKRILLLDACYSGAGGKGSPDVSKAIAQTPPGWVLLSSSKGIEQSFEHADWQHGSFTFGLKQALEYGKADTDQNGQITLKELYDYLRITIPRQNRSKRLPEQNPVMNKDTDDDFVIFLNKN